MKKFRLLLLDANIVIEISKRRLWEGVLSQCEVHLSRTVVDEAAFYTDDNGDRCEIDLTPYRGGDGGITVFDVAASEVASLRSRFDPTYFEKLDAGETESLSFLLKQSDQCSICSADMIVYRVLGNLNRPNQGISLEEILNKVGLGRRLPRQYTKAFREEWTGKGFHDGLAGIGVRRQDVKGAWKRDCQ